MNGLQKKRNVLKKKVQKGYNNIVFIHYIVFDLVLSLVVVSTEMVKDDEGVWKEGQSIRGCLLEHGNSCVFFIMKNIITILLLYTKLCY